MEQPVPTIVLRFGGEAIEHDVLSADVSRHHGPLGSAVDEFVEPMTPRFGVRKAQFMLSASGSIVELAASEGRFRQEVFVPDGRMTDLLLASKMFPAIRRVARMVVLDERHLVSEDPPRWEDPPRLWTTQGSC